MIHGDGETTRDFCHVANVVQANLLAAVCARSRRARPGLQRRGRRTHVAERPGAVLRELLGGAPSRTAACRRRCTPTSAPATSGIRRPTSPRRGGCWATTRFTTCAPACAKRCRGTKRDRAAASAAGDSECPRCGLTRASRRSAPGRWRARWSRAARGLPRRRRSRIGWQSRRRIPRRARRRARRRTSSRRRAPTSMAKAWPRIRSRRRCSIASAARDGDPEAQYSLGWMYANGRGVARDDAVASALFALAAAAGHAYARAGADVRRQRAGAAAGVHAPAGAAAGHSADGAFRDHAGRPRSVRGPAGMEAEDRGRRGRARAALFGEPAASRLRSSPSSPTSSPRRARTRTRAA